MDHFFIVYMIYFLPSPSNIFFIYHFTPVGFGDLTPKSQGGRIATMIYALLSLTPMAFVVGEVKRVLLSTAVGKRKDE